MSTNWEKVALFLAIYFGMAFITYIIFTIGDKMEDDYDDKVHDITDNVAMGLFWPLVWILMVIFFGASVFYHLGETISNSIVKFLKRKK